MPLRTACYIQQPSGSTPIYSNLVNMLNDKDFGDKEVGSIGVAHYLFTDGLPNESNTDIVKIREDVFERLKRRAAKNPSGASADTITAFSLSEKSLS